jgi:acetyl-CoA carboxylase biotin carboxyl carrier protein
MSDTITEIRALLIQFQQSGLKDLHVRSTDWRVFMAQPGGAPNPMQQAAPAPVLAPAPPATPVAGRTAVGAPHLGLFVPVQEPGEDVTAGQVVAILDVLGRKTEVTSTVGGRIAAVHFAANDLVEYGQTLIEIEAA